VPRKIAGHGLCRLVSATLIQHGQLEVFPHWFADRQLVDPLSDHNNLNRTLFSPYIKNTASRAAYYFLERTLLNYNKATRQIFIDTHTGYFVVELKFH